MLIFPILTIVTVVAIFTASYFVKVSLSQNSPDNVEKRLKTIKAQIPQGPQFILKNIPKEITSDKLPEYVKTIHDEAQAKTSTPIYSSIHPRPTGL